jgi:NADH:ubiquinone oxidoreductase subunit F (NADH-binding)
MPRDAAALASDTPGAGMPVLVERLAVGDQVLYGDPSVVWTVNSTVNVSGIVTLGLALGASTASPSYNVGEALVRVGP